MALSKTSKKIRVSRVEQVKQKKDGKYFWKGK